MKEESICYLVGAGPGDPGLMTLKGKSCIEKADVIVYDYLSNDIFLQWAKSSARFIYVGKKANNHSMSQNDINEILVEETKKGQTVVRLKGGDPIIFGRGAEEAERLNEENLNFEIIPGITSAIAAPTYAGIPVTHRNNCSQFTVFTGHEGVKNESAIDYNQLAKSPGTKIMLMGMGQLSSITSSLISQGANPNLPVALIRWATTQDHQTLTGTLQDIASKASEIGFKSPAVAVFGDVVNYREKLNWFENKLLRGLRVVVTRTRKQASGLSMKLRDLGAYVLEIPTIKIIKSDKEDAIQFANLVTDSHTYDWIIFTSPNAVEHFFEAFYIIRKDAREIGNVKIAVVGPGTNKKLEEYHLSSDVMPTKNVAEMIPKAIKEFAGSIENTTMLWVRGKEANSSMSKKLNSYGVILDEAIAYQTVPQTDDPTGMIKEFNKNGADIITFTSSSTVENFLDLGLSIPDKTHIASIGPITSSSLKENNYHSYTESSSHNISGLIDTVVDIAKKIRE